MIWKPDDTVAGHRFYPSGTCGCGRKWLDIRNSTSADLDTPHIAHSGKLTTFELDQIRQLRAREDGDLEAAMGGVSGRRPEQTALSEEWTLFYAALPDFVASLQRFKATLELIMEKFPK
jgi:hypothetical protein